MHKLPVLRPLLPTASQLLPYLEKIDANRYYTNRGPLTEAFEQRLATHFGVPADTLVTCTNGTLALTHALQACHAKAGTLCVMPSWTFVATPASAIGAGLTPYFIDVDPASWMITPDAVRTLLATHNVGAVIVVSPFGMPANLAQWSVFHKETGIPVIIDAAAAFDGFAAGQPIGPIELPVMISLHATKVFGIGEGAAILAGNPEVRRNIQMLNNFGFYNSREAQITGTNAKLNEYMAAIGLAGFDIWAQTRASWQHLSNLFAAQVAATPGLAHSPHFNQGWVSSYGNVLFNSPAAAAAAKHNLEAAGIGFMEWWSKGCHTHAAYQNCPRSALPVTEDLAARTLGLPFWIGMEAADFERTFTEIRTAIATTGASI